MPIELKSPYEARISAYFAATQNYYMVFFFAYDEPSILGLKKPQGTQLYDSAGC